MVDLHLLLLVSVVAFFCRCCFSKLNMSKLCRKVSDSFSATRSYLQVSYNGLMNHGATCYLNSVLQVLFMTDDFREAVNSSSKSEFIDHHLKDLFKNLLTQTSDANAIIQALGIQTVYEQQDAAEYLQKILRKTNPDAAKIFHGEMTERIACLSCQKQVEANVPFWLLPLSLGELQSENSVDGSIKNFFKISYFRGVDQVPCENCDRKTDAAGMSVVKHHPDVLILLLKRFVFDNDYMSYVKINCAVEVPFSLNIPESQTYELYAVIDHVGDLRSGHYTSRIRSQLESRWVQFNNNSVSALESCQLSQKGDTESSRSAYLLFYRKKDTESTLTVNGAEKPEHNSDEVSPIMQNPARNGPVGLGEMNICDYYIVEPKQNHNVNVLRRSHAESEDKDRLQQHLELHAEEKKRKVNITEHLRQNEGKNADYKGEVNDEQTTTDMEDDGVNDNRVAETGSAPEFQDRRERSNSGLLCHMDPRQEGEEEGRAQHDEDPGASHFSSFLLVESVDAQNKTKLPQDLNTPEQETCVTITAQNVNNPSVKQENGKQPGLQQRGDSGLDRVQTRSGFQAGRPSPKQRNVKVLVLEEEEREKKIVSTSKKIIIKVQEETHYRSLQTFHGHNERHDHLKIYPSEQQ